MPVQEELEAILERLHRMREQLRLMPDGNFSDAPASPAAAEAAGPLPEPIPDAHRHNELT